MTVAQRRLVVGASLPIGAAVAAGLVLLVPLAVPPLLVLALASLVRVGDTVVDRLMTALALGTGLLTVAALGFSLWPWGLDPIPVAVAAWVGLWALAVLSRRMPRFPRVGPADLALPVTALVAMIPAWRVLHADGFAGRLALVMIGEDNSRHLMWWAGIRDSGAYLFLAGDHFPDSVIRGTEYYPQGWHLVAAVLDRYAGAGGTRLDHYLALTLVTHAYLLINVVWLALATRRRVGAMQVVAASVVGGAMATGSELFRPVVSGYPSESLGLSLALAAAAVAALAARPGPARTAREPMLVLAATFVALSFAYYVFLVPLGVFVAVWLWRRRADVMRTPVVLVGTGVAALALSAIMPILGVTSAVEAGAFQVAGNGGPVWVSLVVLGGVAVAGVLVTGCWREPGIRWPLVAAACFFGFGAVLALGFQSGYYVHKIWHVPIAVAAALCAALVLRVPRLPGRDGLVRSGTALVGLAAATVVGAGITPWGPGVFTDNKIGTSNLGVWDNDFWAQTGTASMVLRAMHVPPAKDGVTSFVVDMDPYIGYRVDLFLSTLQGTSDELADVHYVPTFLQPDRLTEQLARTRGQVRLLATSPEAAQLAQGLVDQADDPTRFRIVTLPPAPAG